LSTKLARALAPDVRVTVLRAGARSKPGSASRSIATSRSVAQGTPLGRWGRPQEVADAGLYRASPEAAFLRGHAINVNGGVVMQRGWCCSQR
jgi:NAD(P)-dependent dehydrogenase (short-subunit alcohol dehydrogenase family)